MIMEEETSAEDHDARGSGVTSVSGSKSGYSSGPPEEPSCSSSSSTEAGSPPPGGRRQQPPVLPLLLVLVLEPDAVPQKGTSRAVDQAVHQGCTVSFDRLSEAGAEEYLHLLLCLAATEKVPAGLTEYVETFALGVPNHMHELVQQLLQKGHIRTETAEKEGTEENEEEDSDTSEEDEGEKWGAAKGTERCVLCAGDQVKLEDVANIAEWTHISMVGNVLSALEALDPPLQLVVKMATAFAGPFDITDLAASVSSEYGGSVIADAARLAINCDKLVQKGFLMRVAAADAAKHAAAANAAQQAQDGGVEEGNPTREPTTKNFFGERPVFTLPSVLIRKVAGSMMLDTQRIQVKRAALMKRALRGKLAARMSVKAKEKEQLGMHFRENEDEDEDENDELS